jgi:hypothetical protein
MISNLFLENNLEVQMEIEQNIILVEKLFKSVVFFTFVIK